MLIRRSITRQSILGAWQRGTTTAAPQDTESVLPGWVFLQVHPKLSSRDGATT